jgi:hypothetical protein
MIHTIEDLEAEIKTHTRAWLDEAATARSQSGHVWRELRTNMMGSGSAFYCPVCLRLRMGGAECWPVLLKD